MSEQCTYADKETRCLNSGVGRTGETASHWLCDMHLRALNEVIEDYGKNGGIDKLERMTGMTVRAGGGARAMADKMAPSIEAGAKMIAALSKGGAS